MNSVLRKMMDQTVPMFNPLITRGLTKGAFSTIPTYLDNVIISSIRSLDPSVPLKYIGYEYIKPEDEFTRLYTNANSNNKSPFDLAHSDVYSLKFKFEYEGEPLDSIVSIPYAREGNIMIMSGAKYVVMPVLTDTVLSIESEKVFCRLLKDKISFQSQVTNFTVNGEKTEGLVIYAELLKSPNKTGVLGKTVCSIALYLLGEYGFYGSVRKYFLRKNDTDPDGNITKEEVFITTGNVDQYRTTHNVYESRGIKPNGLKIVGDYIPHNVKICVSKSIEETSFIRNFIFGILEMFNYLPYSAAEVIEHIYSNSSKALTDEIRCWRIILGEVAYKGDYGDQKKMENVDTHFGAIRFYIDGIISKQFKDVGRVINTFQDLMFIVLDKYVEWTRSAKTYSANISNKYLDVNYYMCYEIMIGFNKIIQTINKRKNKSRGSRYNDNRPTIEKPIKYNEILKIFQDGWRNTRSYAITRSMQTNFNVTGADYTSDNMIPKCTAPVELQSCGNGIKRPDEPKLPLEAKFLQGTDFVYGQILFLIKSKPSPKFRINPFLNIKVDNGRIVIPNELKKTIKFIDESLRGTNIGKEVVIDSSLVMDVDNSEGKAE